MVAKILEMGEERLDPKLDPGHWLVLNPIIKLKLQSTGKGNAPGILA
jgi:hypothetical protein